VNTKNTTVRIVIMVTSAIVIYELSWTPYAMVSILGIFEQKKLFTPITTLIT